MTSKTQKFIIYFILSLLLIACSRETPTVKFLNTEATILAFGDSLTWGTGAENEESYPTVLSQLIQRQVINAGVPGERTDQGLTRLPALLDQHRPDLLILCHGGNDFLQKVNTQQVAANVRKMILFAKNRNIDVVLIGVPEVSIFLTTAEFYAEIAEEFKIPYQDSILSEILKDNALKSDQIHPNAKGYRLLAETIAKLLKQAQAI